MPFHNALMVSVCAGNVYFLTIMYPTKIPPPHSIVGVCVCVSVAIVTGGSIVYCRYDSLSRRENLHQVIHGIGVSELQETPATHTFISHLCVYLDIPGHSYIAIS